MKVLVKEPGKPYEFREIEKTLEAMQAIVGGYIEVISLRWAGTVLVCDEEGCLKNYEPNAVVRTATKSPQQIVGTFFVCQTAGGKFVGFNDSREAGMLAATFSVYEFGEYQRKEWL